MPSTPSTDGVTVDYLHLGGDGPPLLMVHATGFCSTVWRPMADALSSRFSCWALDVRGHGRSNPPNDSSFDWSGTADDVLAVIDAIAASDAVDASTPWYGVGHSMGGASLILAEERRPGAFAGLWIYEPVIFPGPVTESPAGSEHPGNHLADGAARRRATFASADAAFENYAGKAPMDVFDPRALRGYLERGLVADTAPDAPPGGVRLACEPSVEAQVYRMGGRHTAWAHLAEVGTPVRVVVGDPGVPGPAMFAADIAGRLPRGHVERHPELGHFGPMQAPDAMAASVLDTFGDGSLSDVGRTIAP